MTRIEQRIEYIQDKLHEIYTGGWGESSHRGWTAREQAEIMLKEELRELEYLLKEVKY